MRVIRLNQCNFKCNFCFLKREYKSSTDLKNAKKILLTGGEPFCNKEVFKILDSCLDKNIKVEIQTNASVFYKKENVKLLKKYKEIITEIMIGFHSHDKKTFREITSTNYFTYVVKGIKNLSESGIPLCLHCTMMRSNYTEALNYIKFAEEEFPKIKKIRFSLVSPCGKALKNFKSVVPKITEVRDIIADSIKYCDQKKIKLVFPSCGIPGYPMCFLLKHFSEEELSNHCEGRKQKSTKEFQLDNTKFDKCSNCGFDAVCCGIPKEYIKQYGDSEFV